MEPFRLGAILDCRKTISDPKAQVTKKKNAFEKLITLSSTQDIQKILDEYTVSVTCKGEILENWASIIKATLLYLESESLRQMKENVIDSLFEKIEMLLRNVEGRNNMLYSACNGIVKHIADSLSRGNQSLNNMLLKGYNNLLSNFIVENPDYCNWIKIETHIDLLDNYIRIINTSSRHKNCVIFYSLFKRLPFAHGGQAIHNFIFNVFLPNTLELTIDTEKYRLKMHLDCVNTLYLEYGLSYAGELKSLTLHMNTLILKNLIKNEDYLTSIIMFYRIQSALDPYIPGSLMNIKLYLDLTSKLPDIWKSLTEKNSSTEKLHLDGIHIIEVLSGLFVKKYERDRLHKSEIKRRKCPGIKDDITDKIKLSTEKNIGEILVISVVILKFDDLFEVEDILKYIDIVQKRSLSETHADVWVLTTIKILIMALSKKLLSPNNAQTDDHMDTLWEYLLQKINHSNTQIVNLTYKLLASLIENRLVPSNTVIETSQTIWKSNSYSTNFCEGAFVFMISYIKHFDIISIGEANFNFDTRIALTKSLSSYIRFSIDSNCTLPFALLIMKSINYILSFHEVDTPQDSDFSGIEDSLESCFADVLHYETKDFEFEFYIQSMSLHNHDSKVMKHTLSIALPAVGEYKLKDTQVYALIKELVSSIEITLNELSKRKHISVLKLAFLVLIIEQLIYLDLVVGDSKHSYENIRQQINIEISNRLKTLKESSDLEAFVDLVRERVKRFKNVFTMFSTDLSSYKLGAKEHLKAILDKNTFVEDDFMMEIDTGESIDDKNLNYWVSLRNTLLLIESSQDKETWDLYSRLPDNNLQEALNVIRFVTKCRIKCPEKFNSCILALLDTVLLRFKITSTPTRNKIFQLFYHFDGFNTFNKSVEDALNKFMVSIFKKASEEYSILNWETKIRISKSLSIIGKLSPDRFEIDEFKLCAYQLLKDTDIRCRKYFILNTLPCFHRFLDLDKVIEYLTLYKSHPQHVGYHMTGLLGFGIIAVERPQEISKCILEILSVNMPIKAKTSAIEDIIKKLGYINIRDYLNEQIMPLVEQWVIMMNIPIFDFPIEVFHYEWDTFIQQFQGKIIPILFHINASKDLEQVAHILDIGLSQLVDQEFPCIYAYSYPKLYKDRNSLEPFLFSLSNYIEYHDSLAKQHASRIKLKLLEYSVLLDSETFDYDNIVEFMCRKMRFRSKSLFTETEIVQVLLNISYLIYKTPRPHKKLLIFNMLEKFLDSVSKDIKRKCVIRDSLFCILRCLNEPSLTKRALNLLSKFCRLFIEQYPQAIGLHLLPVVNSLLDVCFNKEELRTDATAVLNIFATRSELDQFVEKLPTIPSIQGIHPLLEKYNSLRTYRSFADDVKIFIKHFQNKHIQLSSRISMMEYLLKRLSNMTKQDLEDLSQWRSHLILAMLKLNSFVTDKETQILISQCLGNFVNTEPITIYSHPKTDSLESVNNDQDSRDMFGGLLEFLTGLMTHHDTRCVIYAAKTMNDLLLIQEVRDFVNSLSEDSKLLESIIIFKEDSMHFAVEDYTCVDHDNVWDPRNVPYEVWIRNLVGFLCGNIRNPISSACALLCFQNVQFAEYCLIHLIELFEPNYLANQLIKLFSSIHNDAIGIPKDSIQIIVNCLLSLRDINVFGQTQTNQRFWETISLDASVASKLCSAYLSSLLFLEYSLDGIEDISKLEDDRKKTVLTMLCDIYTNIDEPDSIYAIENSIYSLSERDDIFNLKMSLKISEHKRDWRRCIEIAELLLVHGQDDSKELQTKMLYYLGQLGHYPLLGIYMKGLKQSDVSYPVLSEYQYQEAWRNGDWSLLYTNTKPLKMNQVIHKSLASLKVGNDSVLCDVIKEARIDIMNDLSHRSLEGYRSIYPKMTHLQILSDIEYVNLLKNTEVSNSRSTPPIVKDVDNLLNKWNSNAKSMINNPEHFEYSELIQSTRLSILGIINNGPLSLENELFWTNFAKVARKAKEFHSASQIIQKYRSKVNIPSTHIDIEYIQLLWDMGDRYKAISVAKNIYSQLLKASRTDPRTKHILGETACIIGKWLESTRSENINTIEDYFLKAISVHKNGSVEKLQTAHFELAKFADAQYQELLDKSKSPEWMANHKFSLQKSSQIERVESLKLSSSSSKDKRLLDNRAKSLRRHLDVAKDESEEMKSQITSFLQTAIENYTACLKMGDKNDITVIFRLIALWFNNSENPMINQIIHRNIENLNPIKFIPLFYQIVSRISEKTGPFNNSLKVIIIRVAESFPDHTYYQLFALALGINPEKQKCASNIIEQIRQKVPRSRKRIDKYERLIRAYLELTRLKIENNHWNLTPKLLNISDLDIPVPTAELSTDPKVENPTIRLFERTFQLVGGVNLPKVVTCNGSDGNKYKQLVKGNDDIRQDAVMNQSFQLINNLLMAKPETSKRKLKIRTFKAIPLNHNSGILEWVNNTTTLGDYLVGKQGDSEHTPAHKRFRPQDWDSSKCRTRLDTSGDKYQTFEDVMNNFKPVFRHFFLEHYLDPAVWFERRLTYTRSIAASSIVGYILGLGDRHSFNILIDKHTAEVIHIDLGVAFDQGRVLRIPEVVPFRLTRDIVDGMGINKTEGTFVKSCEHVMKVLREQHKLLMTVVEVFLHDPLSKWILSQPKLMAIQQGIPSDQQMYPNHNQNQMETTVDAEYMLSCVKRKLLGHEKGGALSIEGQVRLLIRQAQDPKKLCRMFVGWGPWI